MTELNSRVAIIDNLPGYESFKMASPSSITAEKLFDAVGGNTGNIAFVHGVKKILAPGWSKIDWANDPKFVRDSFDHIVICCANQLGTHVDLGGWADRLEAFGRPTTLLGIGLQAEQGESDPELPEGTLRFLKTVSSLGGAKPYRIATRGERTTNFLRMLGVESYPLGCPSLLISDVPDLGAKIYERQAAPRGIRRVSVSAGNPWHPSSAGLERKLLDIVEQYDGNYVVQHPMLMLRLCLDDWGSLDDKERSRVRAIYQTGDDLSHLQDWFRNRAVFFYDAQEWIQRLAEFDLVIGPRYHGVALGIQAGRAGAVITIDRRTHELCQGTGLKMILLDEAETLDGEGLLSRAVWSKEDAVLLDSSRRKAAVSYTQFLGENNLGASEHLKNLGI